MEIRLLGAVEMISSEAAMPLGPPRHRFVLASLILEANRVVPLDRLVKLSWPESPPRSASHAIQVAISRIRSVLTADSAVSGQVSLLTYGRGYLLEVDPAHIDVHRFRGLVRQACDTSDDETRITLLGKALALWRGPALTGAGPPAICDQLGRGLEEARLVAIEDQMNACLRLGRHRDVLDELTSLVIAHPSRERLAGQLMLALYRSGLSASALEVFSRARKYLDGEFGIGPGRELAELQMAILRDDLALAAPTSSGRLIQTGPKCLGPGCHQRASSVACYSAAAGPGGSLAAPGCTGPLCQGGH